MTFSIPSMTLKRTCCAFGGTANQVVVAAGRAFESITPQQTASRRVDGLDTQDQMIAIRRDRRDHADVGTAGLTLVRRIRCCVDDAKSADLVEAAGELRRYAFAEVFRIAAAENFGRHDGDRRQVRNGG